LTLYTTPVIYLYMDKLGKFLSRRRKQTPPKPAELEPVMTR